MSYPRGWPSPQSRSPRGHSDVGHEVSGAFCWVCGDSGGHMRVPGMRPRAALPEAALGTAHSGTLGALASLGRSPQCRAAFWPALPQAHGTWSLLNICFPLQASQSRGLSGLQTFVPSPECCALVWLGGSAPNQASTPRKRQFCSLKKISLHLLRASYSDLAIQITMMVFSLHLAFVLLDILITKVVFAHRSTSNRIMKKLAGFIPALDPSL